MLLLTFPLLTPRCNTFNEFHESEGSEESENDMLLLTFPLLTPRCNTFNEFHESEGSEESGLLPSGTIPAAYEHVV